MAEQYPAEKRNVVLGITGSIAAYKAAELARLLVSRGYAVRCMMSDSAQKFLGITTMEAITGNPVVTTFWDEEVGSGIGHIELADWAQVLVIAPATAECISKLAAGGADSPLFATALATRAPVMIAPAMNVNMYEHPATQENLSLLRKRGVLVVDPEEGALACGWNGSGRLASPDEIFYQIRKALSIHDLRGKKVVISTGPTREIIDPVRFLSNRSSGKMGVALAREAHRRGADVTLVHGPCYVKVPSAVKCVSIESTEQMRDAMMQETFDSERLPDIVIMAAAVSDFKPAEARTQKVKKRDWDPPRIDLAMNADILAELGARRDENKRPILVGFAVETGEIEDLVAEAREKMRIKKTDMIVGNFAADAFELDTNRVWIISKSGKENEVATTYKSRIANKIIDSILKIE